MQSQAFDSRWRPSGRHFFYIVGGEDSLLINRNDFPCRVVYGCVGCEV